MIAFLSIVAVALMVQTAAVPEPSCDDFDDRVSNHLDDESYRAMYRARFAGVRALIERAPRSLVYDNGAVALVLVVRGDEIAVQGYWPNGVLRLEGRITAREFAPVGRWTLADLRGRPEWVLEFHKPKSDHAIKTTVVHATRCDSAADAHWEEGQLFLSCMMDAKKDGHFEIRDLSGAVRQVGAYTRGKRSGVWREYDIRGCRAGLTSYEMGVLSGPVMRWGAMAFPSGGKEKIVAGRMLYRGQNAQGFPSGRWEYWCHGERHFAEYDPTRRPKLVVWFDGCGPPARPTELEVSDY